MFEIQVDLQREFNILDHDHAPADECRKKIRDNIASTPAINIIAANLRHSH